MNIGQPTVQNQCSGVMTLAEIGRGAFCTAGRM